MMRVAAYATVLLVLALTGCASMCDSSYDCDFHAFGGLRDRLDRTHGRVGSVFDPAAAQQASPTSVPFTPSPATTTPGDGLLNTDSDESEESSELRDRLLDELDKMDQLPEIPDEADPDAGRTI